MSFEQQNRSGFSRQHVHRISQQGLFIRSLLSGAAPLLNMQPHERWAIGSYPRFIQSEVDPDRTSIVFEKRQRMLTTLRALKKYVGPIGTLLYPAGFGDGVVALLADHTVIIDSARPMPLEIKLPDTMHSLQSLLENPTYENQMKKIIGLAKTQAIQIVEQYGANPNTEAFSTGYYHLADVPNLYAIPTLIGSLIAIGGNLNTIKIKQTNQEYIVSSATPEGEKTVTYRQHTLPSYSAPVDAQTRRQVVKDVLEGIDLKEPVFVLSKGDNAVVAYNFKDMDVTFLADYPFLGQKLEQTHSFTIIPVPEGKALSLFGYARMTHHMGYLGRKK